MELVHLVALDTGTQKQRQKSGKQAFFIQFRSQFNLLVF